MRAFRFKALDQPVFNSRVRADKVTNKERWLGYFLGPALVATTVSGNYINVFYTDVLHMNVIGAGLFLALMPVLSKIIDAITNIIMGRVVDSTTSLQGKARPWILISGPLMTITTILLFLMPENNHVLQAVWATCTYNLFYSVSYTMYNLSNIITVPVSTRDTKARDTLAMAQSMGINMIPGVVLAVVYPSFVLPYMGVDRSRWIVVMIIISLFAFLGTLIQYLFTRERVTGTVEERESAENKITLMQQFRGCMKSKYWVMIIFVMVIYHTCNNIAANAQLYYANWVVGTYNDGYTLSILNIVGQALLGPGVLIMWPLVKRFGKQKVFIVCGFFAIAGAVLGVMLADNLTMALVALTVRSIGNLPFTYVLLSLLADALDHVELTMGYRCDGFSSSVYSIIVTVTVGLGIGALNLGLAASGYVPPAADGSWIAQTQTVKNTLTFMTFGVWGIGMVIMTVIFYFFDLEKKLPQMAAAKAAAETTAE